MATNTELSKEIKDVLSQQLYFIKIILDIFPPTINQSNHDSQRNVEARNRLNASVLLTEFVDTIR